MSDPRDKKERPLLPPPPVRPQLAEKNRPSLPSALAKLVPQRQPGHLAAQQFDKAFPVALQTSKGALSGVGRNISADGMFIEAKEVPPIGSEVRVVFGTRESDLRLTVVGTVRFVASAQVAGREGDNDTLRGFGLRFTAFEDDGATPTALPQ